MLMNDDRALVEERCDNYALIRIESRARVSHLTSCSCADTHLSMQGDIYRKTLPKNRHPDYYYGYWEHTFSAQKPTPCWIANRSRDTGRDPREQSK